MGEAINLFPCLSKTEDPAQVWQGFLFVVLTQADPCPKFPGQIGPLALPCRWSALPAGLSVGAFPGYMAFQVFWSACRVDGVGRYTQRRVGYELACLPE